MEIQSKKGMDLKVGYTGRRLALARSRFVVLWRENKRREVGYLAEKEKELRRRIRKKKNSEEEELRRRKGEEAAYHARGQRWLIHIWLVGLVSCLPKESPCGLQFLI
ncbi:unnamed protein product [Ilex paraguariensis]|uniref:Uncharacterized protein n=1 Tax=Ilex paraguariensis TaxID=185542 RepID=A0ABC8TEY9_9AQUA